MIAIGGITAASMSMIPCFADADLPSLIAVSVPIVLFVIRVVLSAMHQQLLALIFCAHLHFFQFASSY